MTPVNSIWFLLTSSNTFWLFLTLFDHFRFLLTPSDSLWLILTPLDFFWLFFTLPAYFWLLLTPSDSFLSPSYSFCLLTPPDSFWLPLPSRWLEVFRSGHPEEGLLTGVQARQLLLDTRLPNSVLAKVQHTPHIRSISLVGRKFNQ